MDNKLAEFEDALENYLEKDKANKDPNESINNKEFNGEEFEKLLEKYNVPNNASNTANKPNNEKAIYRKHNENNIKQTNFNLEQKERRENYFENINFENFDIYNFDFSKSINNKSEIENNQNLKNKNKIELNNKEKDFALYKNLEEYICDNNLTNIIDPKHLMKGSNDDLKKIKNFEDNFEEIVEEKNKIIQDLKKIIQNLQSELGEQRNFGAVTKNELLSRINVLKEKTEKLKSGEHEEIISFYEEFIERTSNDYLSFLKKLKENWDLVTLPNLGGERENMQRIFQSMKIQINSMFKENEKLNKNLFEIKKSERMNSVYKNVITKFGEQIDINRKTYRDLNKKQAEYVKELELQKTELLEALHEEKEKSRIDYQKLEELSEQMKQYKHFEKDIAIKGYLKKIENGKDSNNAESNFGVTSYLSNFLNKSSTKPNSPKNNFSPSRNLSNAKLYELINSSPKKEDKVYSPILSSPNFGTKDIKSKSKLDFKKNLTTLNVNNGNNTLINNLSNSNHLIKTKNKLENEHNKNIDFIFKNTGINFEKTNKGLKNFSRTINASKIIFNEKLCDIEKINCFFFEKLDKVDVALRMRFKRNIEIIKDTIDVVKKELEHLNGQFEKFYIIDVILNKLFFDVKIKFEEAKKTKNYTKFEMYMDKITSISSVQEIK